MKYTATLRRVFSTLLLLGCARACPSGASPLAGTAVKTLSFDQAVEEGLHNNLDLIAARYAIPMARADALTAGLWANPSLQADTIFEPFGGNWNQTSAGGPRQFDLGLAVPLDLSGKHGAAAASAEAGNRIAELDFLDAIRQKVLQIRQGYIDVSTKQSQASLAAEKVGDYEKLVRTLENRLGQRPLRPLLLNRARLARDQARMDLRQHLSDLVNAKTSLAIQLGRRPDADSFMEVTALRDFTLQAVPDKAVATAQALENRPDLKALQMAVEQDKLNLRLAHSQVWDDFTLSPELSSQGPVGADPNAPGSGSLSRAYSWDLALSLPLPVFNHQQGNLRKAELSREQAETQVQSLELSIEEEIGEDLEQLRVSRSLIVEYESTQIREARQVRDSEQTQFGTGNIELLDYFDAMEAYNSVLSSYYDAVGGYRKALAQLSASIGKEVLQ